MPGACGDVRGAGGTAPPQLSPSPPLSLLLFLQSAPPKNIFAAFMEDCKRCGMPWHCPAAQQFCVAMFIKNPLVVKYPTRRENVAAFLKHFITQLELLDTTVTSEESDGAEVVDHSLMEAYIQCAVVNQDKGSELRDRIMCYKTFYFPGTDVMYLPVRLASSQFTNVGLSLWPAAFVLSQLILVELCALSPVILPQKGDLRFLELGAGVGLTLLTLNIHNSFCNKFYSYQCPYDQQVIKRVWSCVLTDYQPELIQNILFNLKINNANITQPNPQDCQSADKAPPAHIVDILDWSECEQNEHKLRNWGCNVILAADCIYDVDLIGFFVATLHQALSAVEKSMAIVVQTHRQNETMKVFFEALQKNKMSVCSYRLLPLKECSSLPENCVMFPGAVCQNGCISGFALVTDVINADGGFAGGGVVGCESGWIGSFFIQTEAVVGVHVIRLSFHS